jgi:hypothetical protein
MSAARTRGWRGWIAIAAAYAFALQLILTGIIATQMATASPAEAFSICTGAGDNSGGPGTPRTAHQACVVCAVAPAPPLPAADTAPALARVVTTIDFFGASRPLTVGTFHSPRTSQGPPPNA